MQAENSKVKMRSQETQTQASFLPCIMFEGFQASPRTPTYLLAQLVCGLRRGLEGDL